ncbi:MAG: Fic family protein [Candidatus Kapabacteria bacterium]|nr:Fic family protein [Candidatus Kapabacteria bacterium]
MRINDDLYFDQYQKLIDNQFDNFIDSFNFSNYEEDFDYITEASSVYSSNIEGNSIDLNSYMNYKQYQSSHKPGKEIKEIENLVEAYKFAHKNRLNEQNILVCHKIFSKNMLIKSQRGHFRKDKVGVFGQSGLVYLAIEPEFLTETMTIFFDDLNELIKKDISNSKTFYYASLIYLLFAQIHPFSDGSGRATRLIEKWFLAEKLGIAFWKLKSEKYYKEHRSEYYLNINLGVNYYEINYNNCFPFLLMLTKA